MPCASRIARNGWSQRFQLAFADYLADCLSGACPVGASKEEIEQKVADLFEATALG